MRFQLRNDAEEVVDFVARQSRCRFVHDDDRSFMAQGAGDLHHVFLSDGELLERRRRVEVGFDALQKLRTAAAHFTPIYEAASRHVAHEYILGHREFVEHHGFLVNGGNAGGPGIPWRRKMANRAADDDLALIWGIDAGQDLHDGRFARAVLSDQRRHLASFEAERDVMERSHARKGF